VHWQAEVAAALDLGIAALRGTGPTGAERRHRPVRTGTSRA
jgi:hypothetical protein